MSQLVAIERIAECGAARRNIDIDQTPSRGCLGAGGTELHEEFLAFELHCRKLREPRPQPFQLVPAYYAFLVNTIAALRQNVVNVWKEGLDRLKLPVGPWLEEAKALVRMEFPGDTLIKAGGQSISAFCAKRP